MSLPNVPEITPEITVTRNDAFTLLLASVALEQMAIGHLLNAEGEKLQIAMALSANRS